MLSDKPQVFNIFCGAGGLSEGFRQAGYNIIGGLDFNRHAIATFSLNHPNAKAICADIRDVKSEQLTNLGSIDVLAGGPSCQGYSTHGKRIIDDPRNFLFREFVRIARDVQPSWIVFENVKGMLHFNKGMFRKQIHEAFEELGYKIESELILAANFGVPQLRERVIFIATRTGAPILFPKETHGPGRPKPLVTVYEAIGDLPSLGIGGVLPESDYPSPPLSEYQKLMRQNSDKITLHEAKPVSPHALSIISRIPQGKGIRHLPEEELPERFRKMRTISNGKLRKDCTTLYHRLSWDKPSYTITCYFRNVSAGSFTHPVDNRALSYREAARLQSFPDHYKFSPSEIPRQIGNAVPPLLAKALAEAVLTAMNYETVTVNSAAVRQSARQMALI